MFGLMQEQPLIISSLLEFVERHHGDTEVVSRRVEGDVHTYSWRDVAARSRQVANGLDAEGTEHSDRIATLAWNGYRHLELYYGVSASGRVLHTLNPRLHPDQIIWIINHAEDQVLAFDLTFLPLVQQIHSYCQSVRKWVALCDVDALPEDTGIANLVSYESWIARQSQHYRWPNLDEKLASSLCYTSGTTGNPKGVLYSHRSSILHAYAIALPDGMGLSSRDVILPVVPMFHVNAWGLPYSAALVGAKLVFPGPALDGEALYRLIEEHKVTFAAGVPTVWQGLLNYSRDNQRTFASLKRTLIGGAACPPTMIKEFGEQFGVEAVHAWGMTEISPVGTVCTLKSKHLNLDPAQQLAMRAKQGRALFGFDMKIVDSVGKDLPWDGDTCGDLMVKGAWVAKEYFREPAPLGSDAEDDEWFATGDVAVIDQDGYMQITDRKKDVIKSGGEWISSIDIENIAVAHPAVQMAACIGARHPRWDERPVICVVTKPGVEVSRDDLLAFYRGKIAKWQIPDDVIFVESIPLGATGKILKAKLREQLQDYNLPDCREQAAG